MVPVMLLVLDVVLIVTVNVMVKPQKGVDNRGSHSNKQQNSFSGIRNRTALLMA